MLLLLALSCEPGGGSSLVNTGSRTPIVNGATYADRVQGAWIAADSVTITEEAAEFLLRVKAKVAVDVPEQVKGIPAELGTTDLRLLPQELLMGTDEAKLSEALRETGARALVVHHPLAKSFDRDRHTLSRLYYHDHLDRFQLAWVGEGYYIYLVVDEALQFDAQVAQAAVRWLREELLGKKPAPFPPVKAERANWQLITTLRGQGQELAISLAEGETLDKALIETASDLEVMHRRQREILGFRRLSEDLPNLRFEIHRIRERAFVEPREEEALEQLWEMGMDGAILLDRSKKMSGAWPGSVSPGRGINNTDQFLRGVARDFRWDSLRPWREESTSLEMIRTVHYQEIPGQGLVPMYRGTAPVPLEAVTIDTVEASIIYAGEWYLQNLTAEGQVTYKMWPEENRYSNEYNHVRHELATWNLWQAWTLDPRPDFLEGAIRSQDWTLRALQYRDGTNLEPWERDLVEKSPFKDEILKDGMAYLTYDNNTKLGSVVVGLLGMIEVQRATNDHSKDDLMRKFGRYVKFAMMENGSFRPYHVPPGHPYENEKNDIVPGEAALALVGLAEYFDDPSYLDVLPKFFEYYKPWFKTRAAKKNDKAPWPAYIYDNDTRLELVQFGPWTVMAANAYTRNRPEATDIVDFGLEVAKWMIESYEYTTERTPYPDYIGGYYKFEGELPAMQAFCYGEGTAAAYSMALRARPEQAAYFEKATRETVRIGLQMQHDRLDSISFSRAKEVEGGVKYALNEPKVRIDYTYHMQSALFQWLLAAKTDASLPDYIRQPPSEGLALLLRLQDMPGYRLPGAPVRTSVPRAEAAAPVPADVSLVPTGPKDDEGGE